MCTQTNRQRSLLLSLLFVHMLCSQKPFCCADKIEVL